MDRSFASVIITVDKDTVERGGKGSLSTLEYIRRPEKIPRLQISLVLDQGQITVRLMRVPRQPSRPSCVSVVMRSIAV